MGCWNGTCAISNLPILAGEKIKLILLRSNSRELKEIANKSAYVYSNDVFAPGFFAISGKYNDYGGIENVVDDLSSRLAPIVALNGVERIKAEGKEYDVSELLKDEENKALDVLLNGIERGKLEFFKEGNVKMKELALDAMKAYKDDPQAKSEWKELAEMDVSAQWRNSSLSFVMIREDVWNHVIKNSGTRATYYDDESEGYNLITGLEHYEKKWNKAVNQIKNEMLLEDEDDKEAQLVARLDGRETMNYLFSMGGFAGGRGYMGVGILQETLRMLVKDERDQEMFSLWQELRLIESFMSGTRRGWMPQAGAGSQHMGWEDHQMLAKFVNSVCNKMKKKYEDY